MAHRLARFADRAKMGSRGKPMLRTLSIHLIAMAVLIASSAYVLTAVWPAMPPLTRQVCVGLAAGFVLAWIALLALRLAPGGDAARWPRHDQAIMWLGNAVTVAAFWLEMPYADDALRLMVVIFLFGPITVEVLGSIQRPPARAGWVLTPLVLPISTALYFVVHWGHYSLPVLLFSLANAYVVMSLRRVVQRAVDRAYAARLAAEAARDAKTRFLASASHDLGQPLQAARLFFDQVMRSPDAPGRETAARRVAWAFDSMEQLLRQMLDHLRLESGSVEAHLGPVAVGPLIARIA
jgi:signal transduction histidine kinase